MSYRLTKYSVSLVRDSSILKDGDKRISSMADIVTAMSDIRDLDREQLRVVFVDARHKIIGWEIVSVGTVTASLAHPREIMKGAILSNACGIILVHNHPSGEHDPSEEDIRLTQRINQACTIMGITLLDHIVMSVNGAYSFKTAGRI